MEANDLKARIDPERLPAHIAVIMDGNGRWAKQKGAERVFGHRNAIEAVRQTAEGAAELGVGYLTLYAFSTENWSRPQREVTALMKLLVSTIRKETKTLQKNNIRLAAIGDRNALPKGCQRELSEAIEITAGNTGMVLTLALSYSGRWELTEATRKLAEAVQRGELAPEDITPEHLNSHLQTAHTPDPELLIRTSNEMRVSNFLLWQLAYTELYFTPVLWPDFRRQHLYEGILAFQNRERRFGRISEQLSA